MWKSCALGAFVTVLALWFGGCSQLPEMRFEGQTVYYKGREYTYHPELQLKHEQAGADVGQAGRDHIFQQINGLSPKQWLANCRDPNGPCLVYTEKSLGEIDLKRFAAKEMVVRESWPPKQILITQDREKINGLIRVMADQPPTKLPKSYQTADVKYIHLVSDKYPSVEYVLKYEIGRNGEHYLSGDKLIKLEEPLFDFLK